MSREELHSHAVSILRKYNQPEIDGACLAKIVADICDVKKTDIADLLESIEGWRLHTERIEAENAELKADKETLQGILETMNRGYHMDFITDGLGEYRDWKETQQR